MEQLIEIIKILIVPVVTGIFGLIIFRQKNRKRQEKNNNVQKEPTPKRTDNVQAKKQKKVLPPDLNTSGKINPGDNFNDKTVGDFIVSGTDEMTIDVYKGSRNSVAIAAKINGKPVTIIGIKALEGKQLTNVTIGENITRIEARAFYKNKLTSVTIPNNVTYIGKEAFAANHLTRVTFQGSGVKIEDDTFDGNLAEVYKNSGVGTYTRSDIINKTWVKGDYICSGTNEITIIGYTGSKRNISIPASISGIAVTTIGANAFINKQLTSIYIPYNITSIGSSAFSGNALTSVEFKWVKSIESSAFSDNALTSVDLPRSISYIGSNAFFSNPLTKIKIWENVTLGMHSLGVGFDEFYNTGGRLRGTYYYSEDADHKGRWSGPYES